MSDATTITEVDNFLAAADTSAALAALLALGVAPGLLNDNQKGSDYTLVLTDANQLITMASGTASAWTIPANADVAFPNGSVVFGRLLGGGSALVTPAGGVTITSASPTRRASLEGTYWAVIKVDTDTWLLTGLPAGNFNYGAVGEDVTLDIANGSYQTGYLNGDTTFQVPTGVSSEAQSEGATLTIAIQYATTVSQLDFAAGIKRSITNPPTLPITIDQYSHGCIIYLMYHAGYWQLLSQPITGLPEITD